MELNEKLCYPADTKCIEHLIIPNGVGQLYRNLVIRNILRAFDGCF